jgi:hypothetical protein
MTDQATMWQRSTTRRLLKWLFSWRTARRALISLAVFVTLLALLWTEENIRGKHAWEKFKREWEAKGERFDPASVIPAAVPDGQNFALTPIVSSSYGQIMTRNGKMIPLKDRDTNFVNRLEMYIAHNADDLSKGLGNREQNRMSDLRFLQGYYRALATKTNVFPVATGPQAPSADVLLALSKYDSTIEELRQASRLPYSRFPLDYDIECPAAMLLPHLVNMKRCTIVFGLRAIAELQNGQGDKALEDVKLALRLADSVRTEPTLLSHLVRIVILKLTLQPVWEGLAEHKWSDAQLSKLDQELARLNLLADYRTAMRGELVLFQCGTFDYLRHHPEQLRILFGLAPPEGDSFSPDELPLIICRLIPSGGLYQNQLRCARPTVELYLPLADVNRRIISPTATRHADAVVEDDIKHLNPYNITARALIPALGQVAKKFASGQSSVDLARVAIALERYHLAHDTYPETLDVLPPQFIDKLPHDVVNGQPLHYRREANGQFVLYSVGWNEKDDGGAVSLNSKTGALDLDQGDWVWQYPPAQ